MTPGGTYETASPNAWPWAAAAGGGGFSGGDGNSKGSDDVEVARVMSSDGGNEGNGGSGDRDGSDGGQGDGTAEGRWSSSAVDGSNDSDNNCYPRTLSTTTSPSPTSHQEHKSH